MKRILIVGTSGAGKSTLAAKLSLRLSIPHIELDSLHWEKDWQAIDQEVFRSRVINAVAQDEWIVDGNYSAVRNLIWPRVTTLIWLNYPFSLVLWRVTWRTILRVCTGQPCCNGNRETLRIAISRDSVIWWVITTFHSRRREFTELLSQRKMHDCTILEFRKPCETQQWLENLAQINRCTSPPPASGNQREPQDSTIEWKQGDPP